MKATKSDLEAAHGEIFAAVMGQIRLYESGKVIDENGKPKLTPTSLFKLGQDFLRMAEVTAPEDDIVQELEVDTKFMELHQFKLKTGRPVSDEEQQRYELYEDRQAENEAQAAAEQLAPTYHQARAEQSPIQEHTEAWCTACQCMHHRTAFNKNRARSTGLQANCKDAERKRRQERKAKQQEAGNE